MLTLSCLIENLMYCACFQGFCDTLREKDGGSQRGDDTVRLREKDRISRLYDESDARGQDQRMRVWGRLIETGRPEDYMNAADWETMSGRVRHRNGEGRL